jgi:tetratricopeptide (TPR) repeat protein
VKDFFISYNKADRKWAEWIKAVLEAAGLSVVMQASDFGPGSNFVIEMHQAVSETKRMIAVLSPDYLNALYTQPEWAAVFGQDPTGSKRLLMPVRVRECKPTGLLALIVYIDLLAIDEAEAKARLINGVSPAPDESGSAVFPPSITTANETVAASTIPVFPGALSPIWNVPHQRNPNFVGRDALLDQIHQTLTSKNAAALTAIHGMGGVGKTQLAAEYAYDHAGDYQVVWWIKSEEPAALASDYAALAEQLNLPQKQERDQTVIVAAVGEWLNHNGAWLLIFDNARRKEDLRNWLPQNRAGHMVITSRDPNWGGVAKPLEVEVLTRDDAVRFLLLRTGQDDAEAARLLAEALGDLPLALEQAGAYIETTGKPISEYLALFKTRHSELLQRGKPDDYPDTVATTWEISFQAAQQESPAAAGLLNVCAFLAPDDIPIAALRKGKDDLPDLLAETVADELRFDEAVAALRRYSLIERSDDGLFVHRLVQMVARDRLLDKERLISAEAAVRVVDDAFPFDSDDVRTWPDCERLLPHALAASEFGEELRLAPKATGRLLNQMGGYYQGRGRYTEAKRGFEHAIKIGEAAFEPDDTHVATYITNLGGVLQDLGDLPAARKCHERALRIGEASLGADHPTIASYVANLGTVLQDLGDLAAAQHCYERALRINETAFGPDHPSVATYVNNLGIVLRDLGDLPAARQYLERALRIDEAAFGPDHPQVAICASNLGVVLKALGDLASARQSYERALRIDEAAFGPDHPNVAIRVCNLGVLLHDLGDPDGARQCFERALRILRKFLGDDHPKTVFVRDKLESLK